MQDFLWQLDVAIFKFFNQTLSFEWLNQATPVLTDLSYQTWFKIFATLTLIFVFYKKFKKSGFIYLFFFVLSLGASDFIGGKVKHTFPRPRPFQVIETGSIQRSPAKEDRSFYSNHTSNTFAAAAYLTTFFPIGKIAFYTCAAFIGFTRMHVGVHYPSDVLVGALVGVIFGILFSRLAQRFKSS